MWHCDQCGADAEDHFEVCWSCGAPRAGIRRDEEGPEAVDEHGAAETDSAKEDPQLQPDPSSKRCVACGVDLAYRGKKRHLLGEHGAWSLFGAPGGPPRTVRHIEYWTCPRCRRVELYES